MTFIEKNEVLKNLLGKVPIPCAEYSIIKEKGISARNAAMSWASSFIPNPKTFHTEIGDLIISKKSISDSLAHGFSQLKLDAITTLLSAYENHIAVYIGSSKDINNNPIVDHYFAYPILYKGNVDYVFCRTREDINTHRLYIHEVIMGEEIKQGLTLQSTAHEKPRTGLPLYRNILFDIFSVAKVQQNSEITKLSSKKELPPFKMTAHDRPVKVSASIRPVPAIPVRRMECGLYNSGERIFTTLCPENLQFLPAKIRRKSETTKLSRGKRKTAIQSWGQL